MCWFERNYDFYYKEQETIAKYFPNLHFQKVNNGVNLVGKLKFTASFNAYDLLTDEYQIEIVFPPNYPKLNPFTREVGNRIPDSYHKLSNGYLCLGTFLEIYNIYSAKKNIFNYIKNLLIPYLYNYSYFENYNVIPLGERTHGYKGILQFYKENYQITSIEVLFDLLNYVFKSKNYNSNNVCSCGSRKKIKECHSNIILEIFNTPKEIIKLELNALKL